MGVTLGVTRALTPRFLEQRKKTMNLRFDDTTGHVQMFILRKLLFEGPAESEEVPSVLGIQQKQKGKRRGSSSSRSGSGSGGSNASSASSLVASSLSPSSTTRAQYEQQFVDLQSGPVCRGSKCGAATKFSKLPIPGLTHHR
jgi:hypothetical protein